MHLDLLETPCQYFQPTPLNFSQEEIEATNRLISELVLKNAIERCESEPREYVSRIFLRRKPNGSYGMILDLSSFNWFVDYCKFKQDTLVKMLTLVTQSCHMVSLDLTDAYLLVAIAIAHQKLLKFEWSGRLWKWVSMPFGLTEAPRKFTKLTKPPLALIRQHGYNIANFLDDFFQAEQTYQRCYSAIQCAYTVLVGLGFLPNFNKSMLVPTQCIDALGHTIDSRRMVVYLPPTKVSCI